MTHSTTDAAEATQRSPAQDPRPAPSGRKGISPLGRTERLMRVRIHGVESGAAPAPAGSLTTGPWSYDADGRPAALSAAVLLDNTLAKAVHAAAPDLDWLVTTELQLNVTGPYPADGAELEAWTQASTVDARGGVARGTLLGADGTEYAHATGWFHAVEKNSEQALEHYERQAALPLGPETEAPLSTLLGLHGPSPRRDGGRPTMTENFLPGVAFTADDSLRNPHGATHGGALSMMAGLAAQQAMPDRAGYDLQSLQVRFLRPASGAIATRTRVRHAGRALRIVEVELLSGDHGPAAASKPFVQATAAFRAAP